MDDLLNSGMEVAVLIIVSSFFFFMFMGLFSLLRARFAFSLDILSAFVNAVTRVEISGRQKQIKDDGLRFRRDDIQTCAMRMAVCVLSWEGGCGCHCGLNFVLCRASKAISVGEVSVELDKEGWRARSQIGCMKMAASDGSDLSLCCCGWRLGLSRDEISHRKATEG